MIFVKLMSYKIVVLFKKSCGKDLFSQFYKKIKKNNRKKKNEKKLRLSRG